MRLKIDTSLSGLKEKIYSSKKFLARFEEINNFLHSGEDWTGWVDFAQQKIKNIKQIENLAKDITKKADALIVLGIGGSYLGALAGINALAKNPKCQVIFAGINFSYEDLKLIFDELKDKEVVVDVISKSGTTTETMIAFEQALKFLKSKYKTKYKEHLIITTDKEKGYLREFAITNKIPTLEVPDGIGGRYSVLTDVGLLPFACAGINIRKMLSGAIEAQNELSNVNENNPAYRYALTRYILHTKAKKQVEVLSSFYPRLSKIGAWWTQLFAESEGKNKKGLFVSNLNFSTDLHSVGQFIQQGSPVLFETFLNVDEVSVDQKITGVPEASPINYLNDKTIEEVNLAARQGTIEAHNSAKVPVIQINIQRIDEENLGYLFYFFEYSCAISGKLLGINPFDQPGVEDYKRNMKKQLTK